jgi:thymidylate synthase (FAD)
MDGHAQKEIRDYAKVVYDLSLEDFPVAMKALIEHMN